MVRSRKAVRSFGPALVARVRGWARAPGRWPAATRGWGKGRGERMTKADRAALLAEIEAVGGPGLLAYYGRCSAGYLEATLALLREGRAAIERDGSQWARWDDGAPEPEEPG